MKEKPDESCQPGENDFSAPSGSVNKFNIGSIIAILVGAAISSALVAHHNAFFILDALQRTGWGFFWIFVIQILSIAFGGIAWRFLFHQPPPGFTGLILMLRWIRESINYLLPVARLGGEMVSVRLLVVRGHDVNRSIASIVVDKTIEFMSLFFFALPGLIFLYEHGGSSSIRSWTVFALGMLAALLLIFLAAQRWGLLKLADRAMKKLSGTWAVMKGTC